ncbi:MAG: electron transfer flavoprotein subunit alpha/FixB family protein [Desulfarculus sp.]|nr:electron transfer flavoprotein subunit alpha/FixB family protein [Desulfarculus sp.]
MDNLFAYIMHREGAPHDSAAELLAAARQLAPQAAPVAILAGHGPELDAACQQAAALFPQVWKIGHPYLAQPNAEILRPLLARLVPQGALLLLAHEHFAMDLAPGLSVKLGAAYLPDAVAFTGIEGGRLKAVREEFAGLVSAHVSLDLSAGAVISLRPGAFKAGEAAPVQGQISDKSAADLDGGMPPARRRYIETVAAEAGEVDITKAEVLVSVGRGIQDQDNLELVFDLAKALGAEVSCSRPIVDAKWLPKPRQVGTSGKTVKPKVYLACGISGSSQHLGGLTGASCVIAINKHPKAPIFQRAEVGVVADIIQFLPVLTKAVRAAK